MQESGLRETRQGEDIGPRSPADQTRALKQVWLTCRRPVGRAGHAWTVKEGGNSALSALFFYKPKNAYKSEVYQIEKKMKVNYILFQTDRSCENSLTAALH